MARPKKLIPTYRKHKASGQAVVTIGSRVFYLGPHGTKASHAEYDRLVAEWLAAGRSLPGDHSELTVVELVAAYLRHAKRYYRRDGRTTSEYTAIVAALRPVKALYGRKPCGEFGPIALQAVMQRMADDGLARSTINQNAGRVKRVFRWGVSQELIPASTSHALGSVDGLRKGRSAARETAPVKPVDGAVVDATIAELPEVVGDMIRVQRWTGCRPSEVCEMRPCDIDRGADPWRYVPASHKTEHHGAERVIFIGPQAQAVLLKYLARDPAMHCFRPCDSESKRRAAAHAARVVPLSCGTKPGDRRKRKPRRRRALHERQLPAGR